MLPRGVGGAERLSDAGQDGPGIGVVEAEPDDGDADVSFTAFEGRVDDGRFMSADQAGPMLPVEGQGLGLRDLFVRHDLTTGRGPYFEPLDRAIAEDLGSSL